MSIELKVGEWYETRGGERVKVVVNAAEHTKPIDSFPFWCLSREGIMDSYRQGGSFAISGSRHHDIVKHLPGCTGWDWVEPKPEKWRDAKPEDALRDPPLRCRVRNHGLREWNTEPLLLIGVVQYPPPAPAQHHTDWVTYHVGESPRSTSWWKYCQVLDG